MASDLLGLAVGAAASRGGHPFLAVGDEQTTFAALTPRVTALASGLRDRGLAKGDRVAVLLERSIDEVVALLAVASAGGIAVPVNGKLKDEQVAHQLRDCEPWAVVTSGVRLLALRDPGRLLASHRLLAAGSGAVPLDAEPLVACAGDPQALPSPASEWPAVLLYTSGSTGLAKGVIQTHGNLARGAAIVSDYLELTGGDHLLGLLPLSFDYGLNQVLCALHVGCAITLADHVGLGELIDRLEHVAPTGIAVVPSLVHLLARALEDGALTADHGRSLRFVTNSGGPLRPRDSAVLRAAWPHVQVFAMYGLTEAFRSAFLPPAELARVPGSFGRAIEGVELLLTDPCTGQVIEGPGEGELVHAGALVALGYWRRPEATKRRFRPDPRGGGETVVYSGDLVRRDAEGLLWFVGRMDRMLKVHGHRVSPDEVASAFVGEAGTGEVATIGLPGDVDGDRIHVVVTGDPRDGELLPRLWRRARACLPSYMLPAGIHVLERLPQGAHGKVDEGALRGMIEPCTGEL